MKRVSIVGVLVGGVVDVIATNIVAIPLMLDVMSRHDFAHVPKDQLGAAIAAATQSDPLYTLSAWLLGALASVFGGYIAAAIAKRAEVLNGALSCWLCVAIGILGLVRPMPAGAPLAQLILAFIASPLLGAAGGYVRTAQLRFGRRQAQPLP